MFCLVFCEFLYFLTCQITLFGLYAYLAQSHNDQWLNKTTFWCVFLYTSMPFLSCLQVVTASATWLHAVIMDNPKIYWVFFKYKFIILIVLVGESYRTSLVHVFVILKNRIVSINNIVIQVIAVNGNYLPWFCLSLALHTFFYK